MDDVDISDEKIFEMINSPTGLVAPMLLDLAERASTVARAVVHVRKPGRSGDARPPGYTKAHVHPHVGWAHGGHIYSSANAPADPAIFLEYPAEQIRDKGHEFPFLTTGLWSLEGEV